MTMTQRKIPPCSNLIVRIDLPRPKGGQQECTYHWLQCRQCVFDHSDYGVYHALPWLRTVLHAGTMGLCWPRPINSQTSLSDVWQLLLAADRTMLMCLRMHDSPSSVVAFVLWVRAGMEANLIWLRLCARWA